MNKCLFLYFQVSVTPFFHTVQTVKMLGTPGYWLWYTRLSVDPQWGKYNNFIDTKVTASRLNTNNIHFPRGTKNKHADSKIL